MNTRIEKKQYNSPEMSKCSEGKVREAGIVLVVIVLVAAGW